VTGKVRRPQSTNINTTPYICDQYLIDIQGQQFYNSHINKQCLIKDDFRFNFMKKREKDGQVAGI
jgi:hypothetical protein